MPYEDLIEKHAKRTGLDPALMRKIMMIESSGRASEQTGSYKGLFQLSDKEFRTHGGSGNVFDPEQNTMAAANKLARESLAFKEKYGRDPKLIDIYMVHQQGQGGYAAHMSNPDAPAWKNMYFTAEGQQKGQAWAKEAIWGNLPKSAKARYGSVENVTSKDFVQSWDDSIKGGGAEFTVASKGTDAKTAFLEGKDTKERKGTMLGGSWPSDEPFSPPSGMTVPDISPPRFRIGIG